MLDEENKNETESREEKISRLSKKLKLEYKKVFRANEDQNNLIEVFKANEADGNNLA
jgi:hypothetical protein